MLATAAYILVIATVTGGYNLPLAVGHFGLYFAFVCTVVIQSRMQAAELRKAVDEEDMQDLSKNQSIAIAA